MSVIIILILASLLLAGLFLVAFMWAAQTGQFDDTSTPPMRVLTDDPADGVKPVSGSNQRTETQS